jgi:hypothetical protein
MLRLLRVLSRVLLPMTFAYQRQNETKGLLEELEGEFLLCREFVVPVISYHRGAPPRRRRIQLMPEQ